jgi:hypothetical protein
MRVLDTSRSPLFPWLVAHEVFFLGLIIDQRYDRCPLTATSDRRLWRRSGGDRGIRRAGNESGRARDRTVGVAQYVMWAPYRQNPAASMHWSVHVSQRHDFVRFYIFPALQTAFAFTGRQPRLQDGSFASIPTSVYAGLLLRLSYWRSGIESSTNCLFSYRNRASLNRFKKIFRHFFFDERPRLCVH